MTEPTPAPVTARLTTPAQMVASLPLWLGYVPTRSLVLACQHEPRGRVGLTMRFDLPTDPVLAAEVVEEVVERVVRQRATRVLVAVYTDEPDDGIRAHGDLVLDLCDALTGELPGLRITEAVLVRDGRFWSYLCDDPRCCPEEGTSVTAAAEDGPVSLLEAEQVLRGQVVHPDREALARSLAGPGVLAECHALSCRSAVQRLPRAADRASWRERTLDRWAELARDAREGADAFDSEELADLAVSLRDVVLRDALIAAHTADELGPLLRVLVRFTPPPYDAAVCTALAWLLYCDGGGAEVTVLLQRALRSNPRYTLAELLADLLHAQVPPSAIRGVTRSLRSLPGARRRGPR